MVNTTEKAPSNTKQLMNISLDLQYNAPTHVITRTWEDKGGKWKLVLVDGRATLYQNDAKIRGTSAANHTTLVKMVASIKEEATAAIAWTDDLIKAECADEINEMISDVIIDGVELTSNMHTIFIEAMIKRVAKLEQVLMGMPKPEALNNFVYATFHHDFTDGTHGVTAKLRINGRADVSNAIVELVFDPILGKHDFLAAMLVYNNWNGIAEFCAKVFSQLGK